MVYLKFMSMWINLVNMLAGKYGEGSDDEKTQPYLTQQLTFGQAYSHSKTSQNILKTYSGKI